VGGFGDLGKGPEASHSLIRYAAFFFAARNAAQRACEAAAILFLPAAEILCFAGDEPVDFATTAIGCDFFRRPAHRAFCASAIFRREAADIIRFGWIALLGTAAPLPFRDSIPEIIWSSLSISICAWLRFSRSSHSAFSRFDIFNPLGFSQRLNCIGGSHSRHQNN
jgi:hypothetical protein